MRESIAAVILLSIAIGSSAAAKRTGNAPFVVAFEEQSPFYARCLPGEKRGSKGTTQIVRVRANGDEVITTYSWYNRNGLVLGWSPKAGKVAVMRVRQDEGLPPEKQVEFSFYLGDQYLQSFTTADLVKLGAGIKRDAAAFEGGLSVSSKRAEYRVEGCKQVVATNDYYFTVRLDDTRTLSFDILTGTFCRIEKDGSKQRLVPGRTHHDGAEQGARGQEWGQSLISTTALRNAASILAQRAVNGAVSWVAVLLME